MLQLLQVSIVYLYVLYVFVWVLYSKMTVSYKKFRHCFVKSQYVKEIEEWKVEHSLAHLMEG